MIKKLSLLLLIGFLGSCTRHVPVSPITSRPNYAYREVKPDIFLVWALNPAAEKTAHDELCSHSYICLASTSAGKVFVVERKRK